MKMHSTLRIGGFRSTTNDGELTKTYVYLTNVDNDNPIPGIEVYQLCLSKDGCIGWNEAKRFKDWALYETRAHFLLSSFSAINGILTDNHNIAMKFYKETTG